MNLRLLSLLGAAISVSVASASAVTVVNGDFETDTNLFTVWPGYIGGANPATIPGWISEGGVGINPVVPGGAGDAPFRDNGNNTSSVAFIQGAAAISQSIPGFTIGTDYILSLDFNARNCCGDIPVATLQLNGSTIASSTDIFPAPGGVIPVGADNPWYHVDIPFTAPTESITLRIAGAPAAGGDATLIVDNISISQIPEPTTWTLVLAGTVALASTRRRRQE